MRSLNLFPSCDRVTTLAGGQVRIEHLITTSIGGWIPPTVFNTVFKPKLIEANIHEAAAFKEHALKIAAELAASAQAPGAPAVSVMFEEVIEEFLMINFTEGWI